MIKLQNLSIRRGERVLFSDMSHSFHIGERIGITGKNGCGKSSLFALLMGRLDADNGDCHTQPNIIIAHVAQETPSVSVSALEYVLEGDSELTQLQQELASADQAEDHSRSALLHSRLDDIDAWTAPSRAARLLTGLGFKQEQHQNAVTEFSGGWRMRLNLAQALMCRSDLLLLDEPTNHLDLDAVIWLGEWLKNYQGLLLLISHDRDFLDEVTTAILHIEHGGAKRYSGNYSEFEKQRAEQLSQQSAAYDKQQREIAHMEDFVRRFRAKATKAKQAQSRLKRLESLTRIAPAHIDSPYHFGIEIDEAAVPQHLARYENAALGYGDNRILDHINMTMEKGQRIGLLGHNGAGKSTFIKSLANTLTELDGEVWHNPKSNIGYFAQHQLDQVSPDDTPIMVLQRDDPKASEQKLRDFLGGFAFDNTRVEQNIGVFSGGEKARLVLARLAYQKPHMLLLDEPTNHLDLEMRHALTLALQEYAGTVVVVSHDRYLLSTVCDTFYLVDSGRIREFNGTVEEYADWSRQQARADSQESSTSNAATDNGDSRKEQRQLRAQRRKLLQPHLNAVQKFEKQLAKAEDSMREIEVSLADETIYEDSNKAKMMALLENQATTRQTIDDIEAQWMEAAETLEQAEAELGED